MRDGATWEVGGHRGGPARRAGDEGRRRRSLGEAAEVDEGRGRRSLGEAGPTTRRGAGGGVARGGGANDAMQEDAMRKNAMRPEICRGRDGGDGRKKE